jgi:arylsulfatase A-like enzyme
MSDPRFAGDFRDLDDRERRYASMVAAVDAAVGRLVDGCRTLGVLDRTVFLFTSDNGGLSATGRGAAPDGSTAHRHNAPLRSGKGSAYEGGLRVPFIAAGPGIRPRAAPVATPIVGTDLYPTILSLAGVALPGGRTVDGADLSPLLRGELDDLPPRTILFHMPHAWGPSGPGIEPFSAIRRGDLKLVWFHDGGRLELFDVRANADESRDLAAIRGNDRELMLGVLRERLAANGARLSSERESGKAVRPPEPAVTAASTRGTGG